MGANEELLAKDLPSLEEWMNEMLEFRVCRGDMGLLVKIVSLGLCELQTRLEADIPICDGETPKVRDELVQRMLLLEAEMAVWKRRADAEFSARFGELPPIHQRLN